MHCEKLHFNLDESITVERTSCVSHAELRTIFLASHGRSAAQETVQVATMKLMRRIANG